MKKVIDSTGGLFKLETMERVTHSIKSCIIQTSPNDIHPRVYIRYESPIGVHELDIELITLENAGVFNWDKLEPFLK